MLYFLVIIQKYSINIDIYAIAIALSCGSRFGHQEILHLVSVFLQCLPITLVDFLTISFCTIRCSRLIMCISCPIQNHPLLQKALVPFVGEWHQKPRSGYKVHSINVFVVSLFLDHLRFQSKRIYVYIHIFINISPCNLCFCIKLGMSSY